MLRFLYFIGMFDSQLRFSFVQKNRGKQGELHCNCLIYKFFVKSQRTRDRRKYIVEVKDYGSSLYTIDFYAKLSTRNHPNKYRLKTNQFTFGQVAATLLRIISSLITQVDERACFGILATTLPEEKSDKSTKRFVAYSRILRRIAKPSDAEPEPNPFENVSILTIAERSAIFVLSEPRNDHEKQDVIEKYLEIFREVF